MARTPENVDNNCDLAAYWLRSIYILSVLLFQFLSLIVLTLKQLVLQF
jgi:hypothetical protein